MDGLSIVHVTRAFPPSCDGVSHHVYYLSRRQLAQGHRVRVVQTAMPSGMRDGIEVLQLARGRWMPPPHARLHGWIFSILAARAVVRAHRASALDLLHGHGDAVEAFGLALAARRLRRPLVITIHARLSRRALYRRTAPWLLGRTRHFIAVSAAVRDDLSALDIARSRVDVITTGVDRAVFAPGRPEDKRELRRRLGLPDDAVIAVAAGRLHPLKGLEYLMRACALLPATVRVYVLGDGPCRPALSRLADTVPGVRLVGEVPHTSVVDWLRSADLFVLPSVDLIGQGEGAPTVLLEAMATGLPVVASDLGGVRELVADGETGVLVRPRDPAAVAEAIRALAAEPRMRERMGRAGRARSREHDWDVVSRRIASVYARARIALACSAR
jgi:2-deoxystreptamine N-acetyl-D-glucosaminyltransferase/2-deoxystreptamine glucosyltransferase